MQTQIIRGGYMVPVDSHIGNWQIQSQTLCHDDFLPDFVCKKLKPGQTIIDAGAFDGDHTIKYSAAVGAGGYCIAVEAGDLAFSCLKHNIGLFPHKNVFAMQAAIGEVPGEAAIHKTNDNLGASICTPIVLDAKETQKWVMTITLDDIASKFEKKIDFIKLDIEGWEVKALIGASKTLSKDKPGLLIEVNEGALNAQGDSSEDIFEILAYHHYHWMIAQPQCSIGDPQFDLLCFPEYQP